MTPSKRTKRKEYGRQWNSMLTNSMNNILIDTTLSLRQYLELSLIGSIKMGTQDQNPGIIWSPVY
jgi:hypothetical protein